MTNSSRAVIKGKPTPVPDGVLLGLLQLQFNPGWMNGLSLQAHINECLVEYTARFEEETFYAVKL